MMAGVEIAEEDIVFDAEPHTYSYQGKSYLSVTQVIKLAGFGDDFSRVSEQVMEAARERGRMVHLACAYYDEGELDLQSLDPRIEAYVQAYIRFRMEKKIRPIAVEKRMVCPWLPLAGTPDLVCWMDGRRVVIDRKTSQHMSRSMGLQTEGYRRLWNTQFPGTPVYERYGLRLGRDGSYKLHCHEDPDDAPCFTDILRNVTNAGRLERWAAKYGH